MTLEANTTIDHYKILSLIGKGGMGEVYLAQDTKLERKVAIKFLPAEAMKDSDKLDRFRQEAKAASALNHPGILTIYEIDEAEGRHYIASEYISGIDIGTYVHERKISLEKALDISIQIVKALKAAHESGIVHRDIKPDNVMIREDGIVKILDFGLAKLTEGGSAGGEALKSGADSETLIADSPGSPKTTPGMVMGTVNYMSPEQARGRDIDQRADIFSFGALLYEMLTRKRPFTGESTSDVIAAVLMKDPTPIAQLNAEIPERLQQIVERCLRKDKEQRFASSAELLDELTRLKRHLQIEEIERTILPELEKNETKMFPATTAEGDGVSTTAGSDDPDSIVIKRSSIGRMAAIAAVLIIAGITGLFAWNYFYGRDDRIDSIAVLPFANETGDPDLEYLSDGMTETLINDLSEIPDLKVKARSSVFRFKGTKMSPSAIAKELGVKAILFGRLIQSGDRIGLSLELIDAETENNLWGNKYENSVSELTKLQNTLASDVARELAAKLSGEENKARTTENSKAYQAYLRGRFYWNKRSLEGFRKAIEYFEEANELDPNYALAWSGLADSNLLLPEYGDYSPAVYMPRARTAAEKALELDPDLAEANTSLAYVKHAYDWDFAGAEELYKKAIALDPEYATAYQWYAELLEQQRRFDEARTYAKKAVDLDPVAPIKGYVYANIFFITGDLARSEEVHRQNLEVTPDFAPSRESLSQVLAAQGKIDESLKMCDRLIADAGMEYDTCKGVAFAYAGEKEKARGFLSGYEYGGVRKTYNVAMIHALIGDREQALKLLEKIFDARHSWLLTANCEAGFDGIRKDDEFRGLMKKVGLPVD